MLDQANLTPAKIVAELDKYIIGQNKAKRAVAVALRNRWRRQQVPPPLCDEIAPKNIIMIGTTGVGKTEIARRLSKLTAAPFIKVEATKFTEVGYVGKDVEVMIRDLVDIAVNMVTHEEQKKVISRAREHAKEKLLDVLLPVSETDHGIPSPSDPVASNTREKLRNLLEEGNLTDREVEIEAHQKHGDSMVEIFSASGIESMDINIRDIFGNLAGRKKKTKKMKVPQAIEFLTNEEANKLIDRDKVIEEAKRRVEHTGVVFLDELDKICSTGGETHGPSVSREGVQRDLLPIVEGSNVNTKYGMIKTDHILFIASGAFHATKPSDLIPELQGRFPIRVELDSLSKDDFVKILSETENSLIKQYIGLLMAEGLTLTFKPDAIEQIATFAAIVNEKTEDIGARRLHTIMEKLLDELSFNAPDMNGQKVEITKGYVEQALKDLIEDKDLSRYIL